MGLALGSSNEEVWSEELREVLCSKSAIHVPRPVALWVVRRGEKCDGSLKGGSYDVHGWLGSRYVLQSCVYIIIWVAARGWA